MPLHIDSSELQFYLRTVTINIKMLINKCVNSYNSLFRLAPESLLAIHSGLGDDQVKKGNYDGAIKSYGKALQVDPTNTDVLFKLGKIFAQRGLNREAAGLLRTLTIIDEQMPEAFYLLGSACFACDNNGEAEVALNRAIALNPGYAEAYYKLGLVADARLNHDAAIAAYLKTISLKPNHIKAYQSLGFVYEAKGMRDEAVKYFKKSMEMEQKCY